MKSKSVLLVVAATLSTALVSGRAGADSSFRLAERDSASCPQGESPEYFAARYQWYLERYGVNGVFDPELRLRQVREAYAEFRREVDTGRRPSPGSLTPSSAAPISAGTFRFLGPVNGAGRATAIEPHPTDPNIVYVGAAGGGCWKSSDGGASWRPLTDGLADLSVGAIAVAPTNPNLVIVGTGEGGYGGDFIPGIGIFRSTDGGETWLPPAGVVAPLIYRLSIDPRNANVVLAFTSNGAQRSTDGGVSFVRTSDSLWGDATDVARDPSNADILHATFWFAIGSDTSRYAKSSDGGASWTEKAGGLPGNPKSRMSIAVSADGTTLYSMIAGSGASGYPQLGVYQSTNGGESWARRLGTSPEILSGQGWYDNTVAVDPDDKNVILLGGGGAGLFRSTDGGLTAKASDANVHVDHHQLVFKKFGGTKLAFDANDGGVWISPDSGQNWLERNAGLGTRQYYSVALDSARPNVVYAGAQDNGSNRRADDGTGLFSNVSGGDGFEAAVSAADPGVIYTSSQFSTIWRNTRDGSPNNTWVVSGPFAGAAFSRTGGDAVKPFYSVITLDPVDAGTVYTGTYRLWRSEDAGETWNSLSSAVFRASAPVYAIAVARSNTDRILAAQTNRLLVSSDRGDSFTNLSLGGNGLPSSGILFKNVEIDPRDPDTFYVAVNAGSAGQVYKSTNAGGFFGRADSGLPAFGLEVVRVDPGDSQTLYAGTLVGLYRSTNGGATWARWGDGLPAVAIHEVRASADGARVVVATHGRGVWAADGVNANRPPVVAIQSPPGAVTIAAGSRVLFAGSASDPDGGPLSLKWNFGDGMLGSGVAPGEVIYRTPGVYRVSFIAEDDKGGRGGAFTTVTVSAPNDACANAQAIPLVPGVTVVTRTGNAGTLTVDPTDPPTCSQTGISNSLWFSFTPPTDGTLELDTFGSLGDTVLALYDTACGASGAALACNDDAPDVSGGPSQLTKQDVTAGKPYRILAATWSAPPDFVESVDTLRLRSRFTPKAADAPTPGTTAILPVVLDAFGKNGARFTSDLVAVNRGTSPLTLALTYGGTVGGMGEATASLVIPPGGQLRAADALGELRREGIAIPKATATSSQIGSLTALVTSGDPSALVLLSRTASPNPNAAVGGTFGLFSAATPFAGAADTEAVFVYGLRQTDRDRANLALVHVLTPHAANQADAPITLAVEIFDAAGHPAPTAIPNVVLQPGEWRQLNEVLSLGGLTTSSADGGVARIRRVSGAGRFVAYGVVNDQKTADGSFIPMTRSGELKASDTVLVPIVLSAGGLSGSFFTSELVLANRSAKAGVATLRYVASPLFGGLGSGSATVPLAAGSQRILPGTIQLLRDQGLAIPSTGSQGGSLFVTFSGFDSTEDVYAGVRTGTPNPDAVQGGAFGVFTPGLGTADLASERALVAALRQDEQVRSNLAAVNGGGEPITLSVVIHSASGVPVGNTLTRDLAPGEWYQWSNVLALAGVSEGEGYAIITRTAGTSPWYAYGVLNDAATSDGSVITPVR